MYFNVMKCVITEIHKKHNIWLEIVESFKVNKDTAKDIVSEMYIKVQTYIQNKKADILYNDNEINYYFIYLTLRNLVLAEFSRESKITYWSLRNTLKIIKNQIRLDYENRNDTRNDI
jgi:hypothetical protein